MLCRSRLFFLLFLLDHVLLRLLGSAVREVKRQATVVLNVVATLVACFFFGFFASTYAFDRMAWVCCWLSPCYSLFTSVHCLLHCLCLSPTTLCFHLPPAPQEQRQANKHLSLSCHSHATKLPCVRMNAQHAEGAVWAVLCPAGWRG